MKDSQLYAAFAISLVLTLSPTALYAASTDKPLSKEALAELTQSNEVYLSEIKERKEYLSKLKSTASEYGYNHGYETQMRYIEKRMMQRSQFWDSLFDFSQITSLLSSGAAKGMYLIGGVVDEVDGTIKTVDKDLLLSEGKKYIIRRYPSLRISPPHWVDYLFTDGKKNLDLPDVSLLPKTDQEREVWRMAVVDGYDNGSQVAYDEFRQRYTVLFSDLIGMVRYWRLVESGIIKEVRVKATNHKLAHTITEDGEELTFDPISIQITEQSTFSAKPESWSATSYNGSKSNATNTVRDAIIAGQVNLEEVMNSDVVIFTPEHEATMHRLKREQYEQY
ncbi:type IV secretion system DotC family protein [Vibrio tubiashii]|uniref:type IV secretory system conjugative DNA transfer family protein n=1 Tax=Vibrio tubiashii TaxID=29498 RepID=UPI001EFC84D5|nr:type IV secretory system conjugative DNA transfer family protein [Vibrio tubiashii]MCG9579873.1 type IV secretion system DotC family protein [Vibrio tubiashii]